MTIHGELFFLDVDIRRAWFPQSGISRALMLNFKWPTKHGKGVQHRAKL